MTDPDKSDFHVVPEIAAAVQSFVMARSAVPGFYVYFDIGGGTVDGVAFHFANVNGTKRVNFYSGSVGPLGMAVLAKPQAGDRKKVQCLVAGVITTARKKDGQDWRLIQDGINRTLLGRLDVSAMAPLVVFLGGYGAANKWYRKSIVSTYADFQHNNAGIPPYELNTVPTPDDLSLGPDDDFVRFAIAYGLSVPYGAGPDVALPSQIEGGPGPRPREWAGRIEYQNSKDVYD